MCTKISRLKNGTRVVSLHLPHSQTVAVGIWALAGSRHEPLKLNGISHFLEHMLFKGSAKRSARKISESIEGIGGDINAMTSEENTCFYAAAPKAHFARVCDVLLDMYRNPKLSPRDVELERSVITDEIRMYRDTPEQCVQELLNKIFWGKNTLALPVTGTEESLAQISRQDLVDFHSRHYRAPSTVISAAGAIDHDLLLQRIESFDLPAGGSPPKPKKTPFDTSPQIHFEKRDIGQMQMSLGLPGIGILSPDRYAQRIMEIILGGNSSSRLFQNLREKRGWCYSVSTYLTAFSDTGMFNISLGADSKYAEKILGIIGDEFSAMREKICRGTELRRAKDYILGSYDMAAERTETRCNVAAQLLIRYGRIIGREEWREGIESVTAEQVQAAAQKTLCLSAAKLAIIAPSCNTAKLLATLNPQTA